MSYCKTKKFPAQKISNSAENFGYNFIFSFIIMLIPTIFKSSSTLMTYIHYKSVLKLFLFLTWYTYNFIILNNASE